MTKIILTGVTPSGNSLHIGNYFGALKPLVDLGNTAGNQVYCFISDLHALTTVKDKKVLEDNIRQVILSYLACGVGEENFIFWRQSQVPEHSELATILANFISIGQMKRMHAYKDKLQKAVDQENINMGLFNYPILMAADILLYQSDAVPVGQDQKQHLEITRDIADNFNRLAGREIFKLPQPIIDEKIGRIVGTDGERKMSKSLNNIIGIFDDYALIEKQIKKTFTDKQRLHINDPGKVEDNPIFIYHDLWNENKEEVADLKSRYERGEVGDVEVKEKLLLAHQQYFAKIRQKREYYEQNPEEVEKILEKGRAQASLLAKENLHKIKKVLGLQVDFVKNPLFFENAYLRPPIDFETFMRVEMRVGKVLEASLPAWSDKLIEQKVDFGPLGVKTIFSALRHCFGVEDFIGKKFVYVTNIPARKMGPAESQGMIVAVDKGDQVQRWEIEADIPAGQIVG